MERTKTLTGAALAALALAGCAHTKHGGAAAKTAPADPASLAKVECYGVNTCKGTGSCGSGSDSNCAGTNTCKGLGWLSLTKAECDAKGGTVK
jgi:hypothetical protein